MGRSGLSTALGRMRSRQRQMARSHFESVWRGRTANSSGSIGRVTTFGLVGGPDSGASPSPSPNLDQVAVLRRDQEGNADVWLMETGRGLLSHFTTHPAEDVFPYLVTRRPRHPVFVEPEWRVGALSETRDWRRRGVAPSSRPGGVVRFRLVTRWALPFISKTQRRDRLGPVDAAPA